MRSKSIFYFFLLCYFDKYMYISRSMEKRFKVAVYTKKSVTHSYTYFNSSVNGSISMELTYLAILINFINSGVYYLNF